MLAVSLDCPFLIALSVFFPVYGKTKRVMNSIFEVYTSHDNLHMIVTFMIFTFLSHSSIVKKIQHMLTDELKRLKYF
jgi:predicted membrane protein